LKILANPNCKLIALKRVKLSSLREESSNLNIKFSIVKFVSAKLNTTNYQLYIEFFTFDDKPALFETRPAFKVKFACNWN